MSEEHIKIFQRRIGAPVDGKFGPVTLSRALASVRDTDPAPLPNDSPAVRALRFCLAEADRWGNERVSRDQVAKYFLGCHREGKNIGSWLASEVLDGKHHSFCAAAQGYAESVSKLSPDELWPWRAGALELMRDAKTGARRGQRWLSVDDVQAGEDPPHPGALAIYRNRDSDWRGHAERVITASSTGYRSVGANENGGRWVIDTAEIRYDTAEKSDGSQRLVLLGFVVDV